MGTIDYSQAIKPDTAYLKKIIENSLLCDWAIRIEYHGVNNGINCWQFCDKTFIDICSANNVIQAIINCYVKQSQEYDTHICRKISATNPTAFYGLQPTVPACRDGT